MTSPVSLMTAWAVRRVDAAAKPGEGDTLGELREGPSRTVGSSVDPLFGGRGTRPPDGLFGTDFSQGGGDRDRLIRFLRDLELLLAHVHENPENILPPELRDYFTASWVVVRPRFGPAIEALGKVPLEDLAAAGLAGAELEMKLRVVGWVYERFQRLDQFGGTVAASALAAVLSFADTVADSIPVIKDLLHPILEHKALVEKTAGLADVVIG